MVVTKHLYLKKRYHCDHLLEKQKIEIILIYFIVPTSINYVLRYFRSMMGRLLSLLGVSARLGLAGGTLYGSHQLGVWGNGKQGEKVRNIIVLSD